MKRAIIFLLLSIGLLQAEYIPKLSLKQKQENLRKEILLSEWFRESVDDFEEGAEGKIHETQKLLNGTFKSTKRGYYEEMFNATIDY